MGLAISDDLGLLAHPLETIHLKETPDAAARIVEVVSERGIETLVFGLPARMDGTEGTAAEKVRAFAETVRRRLPDPDGVGIEFQDEYYSTATAQEQLRDSGRTARRSKPVIDQAAACVILQEYLDRRGESAS